MSGRITRAYARGLNAERRKLGPAGSLFLLNFESRDENGIATYSEVKAYLASERVNGWRVATVRGPDGAFYTGPQIADVDGDLERLLDGDGTETFTDFAFNGRVYRLEKEKDRPVTQPKVWTLRWFETGDRYEP